MKKSGSAVIETPHEAGYRFIRFSGERRTDRDVAIFRCEDGPFEVFVRREEPISGWQLEFDGAYYEFVSSK